MPATRHIDLALIFVIYIGLSSPPFRSALSGTLFGLLYDWTLGYYLGINGLSKTLVAFTASYLSQRFATEPGIFRMLLLAALSMADMALVLALLVVLGLPVAPNFLSTLFIKALVTAVIGEIIFRVYDKLKFPPKDFRRLERAGK